MFERKFFSTESEKKEISSWLTDSDELSLDSVASLLRESQITECQPLPRGSNCVYLLSLKQLGQNAKAIYKPRRGESPLWDFPDGTLYQRECAAYLVSQALKWFLVPPTTIREGPYGIGMLQWFIASQATDYGQLMQKHLDEFKRIAAFDWLVNNADRKAGHCLEGLDGKLWVIDHGLTFNVVPKLRTVIWDFSGQPVPEDVLTDFESLSHQLSDSSALVKPLSQLLSSEEIEALRERLMIILTQPVYPSSFGSYRRVPWPPY